MIHGLIEPHTAAGDAVDQALHILPAVFDLGKPGGLGAAVRSLRRVAGRVRDLVSLDMWRAISGLADFPTDPAETYGEDGPTPADLLGLLNRTVITLSAFGGLATEA